MKKNKNFKKMFQDASLIKIIQTNMKIKLKITPQMIHRMLKNNRLKNRFILKKIKKGLKIITEKI